MFRPTWLTGWLAATLAVASMAYLTGCAEESELGGPGVADDTTGTNGEEGTTDGAMTNGDDTENGAATEDGASGSDEAANEEQTFSFTPPLTAENIPQGGNAAVTLQINRGSEFDQTVEVTFKPPQGITLEPQTLTFEPGVEEMEVIVTVDATAELGEKPIEYHAQPETGKAVDDSFMVEVTEAEQQ